MASRPLASARAGRVSTGGVYDSQDGFWAKFSEVVYRIFLPLVLRNSP
jgi:hypothetical protein